MIIKVLNAIYIEVADKDQGEEACHLISSGLEREMREFPQGDVLQVEVDHFEVVSAKEIKELGLEE